MKMFLSILLIGAIQLAGAPARADVLGDADDRYVGLQISIPVEAKLARLWMHRAEYSAMMVEQQEGLMQGLVYHRDRDGYQTLGYLRPTRYLDIGKDRITDYAMPVVNLTDNTATTSNYGTGESILYLAIGIALFAKVVDHATEEIVECITLDPDCDNIEVETDSETNKVDGSDLAGHQAFWFAWSQFQPGTRLWPHDDAARN
jgi:hypothetical protein